jgi:transglutaminase-like putative cysteine protease
LRALEASLSGALDDLLVARAPSPEPSPFLLTLSALAWTTGAYAAISVGRHARPSGAVVPIGLMLLVPLVLAEVQGRDSGQLLWLAIGATAALLLVLRLNLERQRVRWLRRHVTGGWAVGRSFLGGGAVLVLMVTLGAMALTAVMGTRPLAASWDRLGTILDDLGMDVGAIRRPSDTAARRDFPATQRLQDEWLPSDTLFFSARLEDGDEGGHYWRGSAYDRFDGRAWARTAEIRSDIAADDDILGASEDVATEDWGLLIPVDATITSVGLGGRDLVAPQNPLEVDRDTVLWSLGEEQGPFQLLQARDPLGDGDSYRVSGAEPDVVSGLSARMLRTLGDRPDPDWIGPFLGIPDGSVGPRTRRVADDIAASLPRGQRDDRYRLAHAVQSYLVGSGFRYETDVTDVCPPGMPMTDCLLESQRGFCQQYATTMVMMLRLLEVPARYVVGFLPGDEVVPGQWEVWGTAAHAWVEVYFNGFGWVRFDPTPSTGGGITLLDNGQQQTILPEGDDPTTPGGPDGSPFPDGIGPDETDGPFPSDEPSPSPEGYIPPTARSDGGLGMVVPPAELLVAAAVSLAMLGLLVAFLWFRRLPAGGAERAWQGITGVATRFGRGPEPSQTPYEYSVILSRVVPRVARDLRTVADAKVEATYGGPAVGASPPAGLRGAYARARTGLLALLFRRRG